MELQIQGPFKAVYKAIRHKTKNYKKMTIKEIIEKNSELGENTKVTGLEFSKFDPVMVKAEKVVVDTHIVYAAQKEQLKEAIDRDLKDRLLREIYEQGFVFRDSVDDLYPSGCMAYLDAVYCLKPNTK